MHRYRSSLGPHTGNVNDTLN